MANTTNLRFILLAICAFLAPFATQAAGHVTFVGDNPKFDTMAQRAAQTIMQRPDCILESASSIDMESGAFLAKSLGMPISELRSRFHEQLPPISAKTRLFVMECKLSKGGFDNFWLREGDIGNVKAVFRQGWK